MCKLRIGTRTKDQCGSMTKGSKAQEVCLEKNNYKMFEDCWR